VVGQGEIVKTRLEDTISSKLSPSNVLYTGAWRVFMTYAKEKGFEHNRFKSDGKERVRGVYHIQNANSYHSRLKGWINWFNSNYLYWFSWLEIDKHLSFEKQVKQMLISSCPKSNHYTVSHLKSA
jgi:hypothetical protein